MSDNIEEYEPRLAKSDKIIYRSAAATTVALALAAFALSYNSLHVLAMDSGVADILSYIFPLVIDGLMLSGTLQVLYATSRGKRSWGGITLVALGVVSSVAGNISVSPPGLIAQLVHGASPVVLFLSLESLTYLLRQRRLQSLAIPEPIESGQQNTRTIFAPTTESFASGKNFESIPVTSQSTNPEPKKQLFVLKNDVPAKKTDGNMSHIVSLLPTEDQDIEHHSTNDEVTSPVFESMLRNLHNRDARHEEDITPKTLAKDIVLPSSGTVREKITFMIENNEGITVEKIAQSIEGDRKYIRKIARAELEKRQN